MGNGKLTKKIWQIAMGVVIVYTAVLTVRNLFTVITVKHRMSRLEEQGEQFQARITEDSTMLENLKYDEYIEAYAREHYNLQKRDETVYILKD